MKITDLLSKQTILIGASCSSKEDTINQAVALMAKSGAIRDVETYKKGVFKREEESTTGIGEGIAIPHCKSDAVSKPALAAMVIPNGVDYASLDGEPVKLLFLIAAPNSEDNVHLEVLARLSQLLMDPDFSDRLKEAKTADEFMGIIDEVENAKVNAEEKVDDGYPRLLGVTGCPTGIAHTYMAAEAIEKAAKEMGISIKVETDGQGGVKNELTDEEIAHAEGIIVAADIGVNEDRFAGKRLVKVAVAKGIHEPKNLINMALDPSTPIYKPGEKAAKSGGGKEKGWRAVYKHLMNGISHMLPFVIGGGILTAIAFLIDTLAGNAGIDPSSFGSINPVAAWFKTIGGYAMGFMLWVLAGFIGHSIAGRPGLVVGMVGGFLTTQATFNIQAWCIDGIEYYSAQSYGSTTPGFLAAIAAGFLAGYIIKLLAYLFKWMPKSLESLKAILIYPILGTLLIGLVMWLLNTPFVYINIGFNNALAWLNDQGLTILLCTLLAAMMAIDMGGPINKAAYVFGTAMLAQAAAGQVDTTIAYTIMAAVMIGGMVPPLGIAIACNLFPQKFTKDQRKEGYVNYIMGLSFITEGAIPFAAADPWRVILSSVAGSAVAGLFSSLWTCTLMAPHGGVFVFITMGNWWLFLVALVIGSFVTAFLLGILKKDVDNPELGKWKGISFPWGKKKALAQGESSAEAVVEEAHEAEKVDEKSSE